MINKCWDFIKENVAAIITVATAIFTVVYAALRLCMYAFWQGYFLRLNIDISIMNLNFDKSIFTVIFVSVILFITIFFMVWAFDILNGIRKKEKESQKKGIRKIIGKISSWGKGMFLSSVILFFINISLVMLLASLIGISINIRNVIFLYIFLYIAEMLLILTQMATIKQNEKKEKVTERDLAFNIIGILIFVLLILAALFYGGNRLIDMKTRVQLTESNEYMVSYCDGEHYVLHKVEYDAEKILIFKNEQKMVNIENCEISIKHIKEIEIRD